MNIMRKLRGVLVGAAALVAHAPAGVEAQVVQPVYTRPSKGAALVVFNTSNPAGSEVSAVYDMSAFAEVQLEAAVTSGASSITQSFGVSGLGRYIKVQAVYSGVANNISVTYNVLGADTTAGPFVELGSPGARQVVQAYPNLAITSAKLTMTPLPYATTQYTRPAKGSPMTVWDRPTDPAFSPQFSPVIDMRGFASVSITVVDPLDTCTTNTLATSVWGGDSTDVAQMRILQSSLSLMYNTEPANYVVNVPTNYISIANAVFNDGNPPDCNVKVVATPLPFVVDPKSYPATRVRAQIYTVTSTGVTISLLSYLNNTRLQNAGAFDVVCEPSIGGTGGMFFNANTANKAGGAIELYGLTGDFFCSAPLAGAGSSPLYLLQY